MNDESLRLATYAKSANFSREAELESAYANVDINSITNISDIISVQESQNQLSTIVYGFITKCEMDSDSEP